MNQSSIILEALQVVEPYYLITLIVVGIVGNFFSFYIFRFTKLKHQSASLILSALAISDNGFLVMLFIANIKYFQIDSFNQYSILCKLNVYFTYVCCFLSSWYVVLFNLERFIGVMFPLRVSACTKTHKVFFIYLIMIFSLVFYSVSLVTTGIEINPSNNDSACVTHTEWIDVAQVVVLADMVLTMLLPFIIIVISNLLIVSKLMDLPTTIGVLKKRVLFRNRHSNTRSTVSLPSRSNNQSTRPSQQTLEGNCLLARQSIEINRLNPNYLLRRDAAGTAVSGGAAGSLNRRSSTFNWRESIMSRSVQAKRLQKYSKTTRMLIIISVTFLLLHSPIAYSKLSYLFQNTSDQSISEYDHDHDETMERITCYIYYLNFSLNFFLYTLSGSNFRTIFLSLFGYKPKPVLRIITNHTPTHTNIAHV